VVGWQKFLFFYVFLEGRARPKLEEDLKRIPVLNGEDMKNAKYLPSANRKPETDTGYA
jgi:hypothetical protein